MKIIFDMDGVIVDSEYVHAKANVIGLESLGISITMDYAYSFVGSTLLHMMEVIHQKESPDCSIQTMMDTVEAVKHHIFDTQGYPPVPGAIELIESCKKRGNSLALASSSAPQDIERVLSSFQILPYFTHIISGTTIEHPKPAPDIFLKAMHLFHASPSDCVIIEDSTFGVNAAKAAGIPCIGFENPHSGSQDLSNATFHIQHMSEALDIIEHISSK